MKFLAFAVLLFSIGAQAEIRDINSFADSAVTSEIEASPSTTWVIFDIDNTLLHPETQIGSHQWGDYLRDQRVAMGDTKVAASEYQQYAFAAVQDITPMKLTETSVFPLINRLRAKSFPSMALTARPMTIIAQTLREIAVLGFHFEPTFPGLVTADASVTQGVVFSGDTPKGIL